MDRDSAVLNGSERRDSHDVHEMQWPDGRGSFTGYAGYAGKFCADVDAGTALRDLRQHRGPPDQSSPDRAAHAESQSARDTLGLSEKGPSAGGSIVR